MVDAIDLKLIELLRRNSRASFADLGRQISLSPSAVRERVQRMEETGVIRGYGLNLDHAKLGQGLEVFIMLKVFSGKLTTVLDKITEYPEVQEAFRITGPQNIHMRVVLRDQTHLQQFIDELINYGDPTTHLVLSELKKL